MSVMNYILIDGMALTDPQFNKYPMLLSLLKFHHMHPIIMRRMLLSPPQLLVSTQVTSVTIRRETDV